MAWRGECQVARRPGSGAARKGVQAGLACSARSLLCAIGIHIPQHSFGALRPRRRAANSFSSKLVEAAAGAGSPPDGMAAAQRGRREALPLRPGSGRMAAIRACVSERCVAVPSPSSARRPPCALLLTRTHHLKHRDVNELRDALADVLNAVHTGALRVRYGAVRAAMMRPGQGCVQQALEGPCPTETRNSACLHVACIAMRPAARLAHALALSPIATRRLHRCGGQGRRGQAHGGARCSGGCAPGKGHQRLAGCRACEVAGRTRNSGGVACRRRSGAGRSCGR